MSGAARSAAIPGRRGIGSARPAPPNTVVRPTADPGPGGARSAPQLRSENHAYSLGNSRTAVGVRPTGRIPPKRLVNCCARGTADLSRVRRNFHRRQAARAVLLARLQEGRSAAEAACRGKATTSLPLPALRQHLLRAPRRGHLLLERVQAGRASAAPLDAKDMRNMNTHRNARMAAPGDGDCHGVTHRASANTASVTVVTKTCRSLRQSYSRIRQALRVLPVVVAGDSSGNSRGTGDSLLALSGFFAIDMPARD